MELVRLRRSKQFWLALEIGSRLRRAVMRRNYPGLLAQWWAV